VITDPPPGLIPSLHARLSDLIQRSLGDPRFYEVASNKFLLGDAALAAGVRVPDQRVVEGVDAAIEAARHFRYPAVVKRQHGSGGDTVRVVHDDAGVVQFCAQVSDRNVLVQAFVKGQPAAFGAVSLGGLFLAGITAIRLTTDPPETGPGTVVQLADRPDVAAAAAKMIEVLGISGFSSFDFLLEEETGLAYLLECNPRR